MTAIGVAPKVDRISTAAPHHVRRKDDVPSAGPAQVFCLAGTLKIVLSLFLADREAQALTSWHHKMVHVYYFCGVHTHLLSALNPPSAGSGWVAHIARKSCFIS